MFNPVKERIEKQPFPEDRLITADDYKIAIDALSSAATQLKPDGNCCAVCGDNDHQAWECHRNPLVLAGRVKISESRWRCYHCNEIFDDPEAARKHFGNTTTSTPLCISKKCLCTECPCNPVECSGKG